MGKTCVSDGACSYDANIPQTVEGWEAWATVQSCQLQFRAGPSGAYAFDLPALMVMGTAAGYDPAALAELLPAADLGFAAAAAERADHGHG